MFQRCFLFSLKINHLHKQISHCVNCADTSLQGAPCVSQDIKRRFIFFTEYKRRLKDFVKAGGVPHAGPHLLIGLHLKLKTVWIV